MFDPASILPERPHHLSRSTYDRMIDSGAFSDLKIELLHGVIVEMSPQGTPHAAVIRKLTNLLVPLVAGRALVQAQSPLALTDDSEPEPDVCIVPPGEYLAHTR